MFEINYMLKLMILVLSAALVYCYYRMSKAFRFWQERGISTLKPTFPFGNFGSALAGNSMTVSIDKVYKTCKGTGAYAGYYMFGYPALIVLDPNAIKDIIVKDFQFFHSRGIYHNEEIDPLSAHLFALDGQRWRALRTKLSPAFTSSKTKMMFPAMIAISNELKKCMSKKTSAGADLDIKEICSCFTTDMIVNCALGVACNSVKDSNTEFRNIGREIFNPSLWWNIKKAIATVFCNLGKSLGIRPINKDITNLFIHAISDVMKYRQEHNASYNDLMQLLIQLMKRGHLDGDESIPNQEPLTENEVFAQAFTFFVSGSETTATTMAFGVYELAMNPDIQKKTRDNINMVLEKHGGEFTYEALLEMDYLDLVIDETLRKYPVGHTISRECKKDYTLPGTNVVIPNGTLVYVPVKSLHSDPDIYPDPDRFDPERFTEENKAKRHHFAYLPFGEGPRICIGIRFGMMQTRLGLITILRNYTVKRCDRTNVPLKMNPKSFITSALGGIWLHFEPIPSV